MAYASDHSYRLALYSTAASQINARVVFCPSNRFSVQLVGVAPGPPKRSGESDFDSGKPSHGPGDHATPRSCHTPPSCERDVTTLEPASPHCCAPTDLTADVPAGQTPVRASSFLGGPSLDAVAHVPTVDGCRAGNEMGGPLRRSSQATSGRCLAVRHSSDWGKASGLVRSS